MDGLRGLELSIGDEVHIEASPSPVVVVVPQSRDYFSILRSKLMWGAQ
jgi:NAD+ kinase